MKRYDKYKQTGSLWIGNIPSHWESKRLRFVCEFRNGYTPSKANPDFWTDGTIPWYRMEDIRDSGRHLKEAKQYVTEEAVKGGGLFDAGSFILATTATIGEHAVLIVDSLANQRFTNLKIRKSLNTVVDNEFFFYFLYVIDDYCKSTTKTATFAAVNIDDLKNFEVAIPPLQEQHRIVNYINNAISTYDAVISTQERRIALLEELKQSVITKAVTHGINPNATLRPSGIDWIGNIPQHWEVMPLKYALREPLMYGANESADSDEESAPRYIRITDIDDDGNLKVDTVCRLSRQKAESYLLKKNDILFARSGATVGKTYIHINGEYACFAGYLIKAECNEKIANPFFVYYYTKSKYYSNWKEGINIQATIQNIGADKYSVLSIPVPPLSEQQEIVAYVDSKIKPIDASIAKAKREIELLKELKQSVITEAVTGKIKVY